MSQAYHRGGSIYAKRRRMEIVAYLYFDGCSVDEIAEDSGYSPRTISRDIEYIEAHREEFLG